jgi:hypothetical protein
MSVLARSGTDGRRPTMRLVQLLRLVDEVCKTGMHLFRDIRAHECTKQTFCIDSVELSSDGALRAGLLLLQLAGSSLGGQLLDFERHIGNTHVHQWKTLRNAILQCSQLVWKHLNLTVVENAQPLTHGCISGSVYAIDMAVQTNRQLKVADLVELRILCHHRSNAGVLCFHCSFIPHFAGILFRSKWGEHADLWLREARRIVNDLWLSKYASLPVIRQQTQGPPVDEMSGDSEDEFERFLIGNRPATEGFDVDIEEMDEYERWQLDRSSFDTTVKDVVEYWIGKREQYRRIAATLFSSYLSVTISGFIGYYIVME